MSLQNNQVQTAVGSGYTPGPPALADQTYSATGRAGQMIALMSEPVDLKSAKTFTKLFTQTVIGLAA